VSIVATHLDGAERIEWILNPDDWPVDVQPVEDWIGPITVDGRRAGIADVRRLLRVHRVAGDETLSQAIALRIGEDATLVQRMRRRAEHRAGRLDDQLHSVVEHLDALKAAAVTDLSNEAAHLRAQLDEDRQRLPNVHSRYSLLDRAHSNLQALVALEAEAPELERLIAEQDGQVAEIQDRVAGLEERLEQLSARIAQADVLGEQLKQAEAELRRRVRSAEGAYEKAAAKAADLGQEPEAEAVSGAHQTTVDRRDRLAARLGRLGMAPRLSQVSATVTDALADATASGLGDAPIARLDDDERIVSVDDLARGVARETSYRGRDEEDALVDQLQAELHDLEERASELWSLRQLIAYAERQSRRATDQAASVDSLREQLDPDAAAEYQALSDQLADAREQHLAAVLRRTDLIGQLQRLGDGRTPADIEEGLGRDLAEADVSRTNLEREWTAARLAHEQLTTQMAARVEQLRAVEENLEAQVATAQAVWRRLLADPASAWMQAAGLDLPNPNAQLDPAAIGRLAGVAARIEDARALLERAVRALRVLEPTLAELRSAVEHNNPDAIRPTEAGRMLYDHLLGVYSDEFSERLSDPEVAAALFESGTFVRLDLRNLAVTWRGREGNVTRPLEAFSSGERAFAYTLSKLASIAVEPTRNRVIALDEFGAFLARDRLDRLVAFLRQRVLGKIAQQVIIILPLTQDYAGQIENTTGEWHEIVMRRAELIREQRYFAEAWEESP